MSALVVFSGGQDSTTCLYWAKQKFGQVEALTFDYGQRHRVELDCAEKICRASSTLQKVVRMDFLAQLSPNALTDSSVPVQADGGFKNLPSTFVPGRNILFLTLAASYALPRGIQDIVIGACETDFSGYPDCRDIFMSKMESALAAGLDSEITLHRPLMKLSKAQTFAMAEDLGCLDIVLRDSHSCYEGSRSEFHAWGFGCGKCPACNLRRRGFEEFTHGKS